jgi:hypothetical protein
MFALVLAALAVADAPKVEPAPAASTQPPRIVTARVKGDNLVSVQPVVVQKPVRVKVEVENNGKIEVREVTQLVTETKMVEQTWSLKKATAITAGGKKIDLDDLKKKLAKAQPIVLSADGKAVDASYLKLFDKDAIVIVVPIDLKAIPAPVPQPIPLPVPKDADR